MGRDWRTLLRRQGFEMMAFPVEESYDRIEKMCFLWKSLLNREAGLGFFFNDY
jgi:hypothetical protein